MNKTNLKVTLVSATDYVDKSNHPEFEKINERYNYDAGLSAGICYMPGTFADLEAKPLDVTLRRAEGTKVSGHHSVFEHNYVSLLLEDIPKLFAMLLNNEKVYVTSEKSARYTKMKMEGLELELYNKWLAIFEKEIAKKYGNEAYFDPKRITKLAQENARYFLSIYTPTTLRYTVSYRQLNYMYSWLKNKNGIVHKQPQLKALEPYIEDFCKQLEELHLIDDKLADDQKGRDFSLFGPSINTNVFENVYQTEYPASYAQLAQAQRHRTINYRITPPINNGFFYVPKLIKGSQSIAEEWLADMRRLSTSIPQATMISVAEMGTVEDFKLKMSERLCTAAQLEINDRTKQTLKKYIALTNNDQIKADLENYNKGARCTFGYKCKTPCSFKDGIKLTREI